MLILKSIGVFVSLCVIAVGVWFLMVSFSPSYNDCINNKGQHPTENYTADGQQIVDGPIDNPTVTRLALRCGSIFANRNGEAFTGLFTIILTFATMFLGYMAWDQGHTSRAQLRAYMSALPKLMIYHPRTKTIVVYLKTENVGQTPARDTQTYWRIAVLKHPFIEPMKFNRIADKKMGAATAVVFPGKSHTPARFMVVNDEIISDLRCPQCYVRLYVYGTVYYSDVFKRRHETEFCCFLDHQEFDEWWVGANRNPGVPVEALFKFSEFNNILRDNTGRPSVPVRR